MTSTLRTDSVAAAPADPQTFLRDHAVSYPTGDTHCAPAAERIGAVADPHGSASRVWKSRDGRIIAAPEPGARFAYLVSLGSSEPRGVGKRRHRELVVRCDCGIEKTIKRSAWGFHKSCGCKKAELVRSAMTSHGMAPRRNQAPEYKTWCGMRARCENPNKLEFVHYGGRGIRVCERWRTFENFIADMGPRPSKMHSIERLDTNGNYEPSNCAWVTWDAQARNKRSTVRITAFGETLLAEEWESRFGVSRQRIWERLRKGATPEVAVSAKRIHPGAKLTEAQIVEIKASADSTRKLARRFGVHQHTIWSVRHDRTWRTVEASR
jgi:hypothetical protein